MKGFWVNLVKNKKNGQINISLPKKKIPSSCKELLEAERLKLLVEDWE